MLGGGQVVAIEEAHAVTGQPGGAARGQGVDDRRGLLGGVLHQGGRQAQFHAVELVVDGLVGDPQRMAALAIGGVDGRLGAQDDRLHQLDEAGE